MGDSTRDTTAHGTRPDWLGESLIDPAGHLYCRDHESPRPPGTSGDSASIRRFLERIA